MAFRERIGKEMTEVKGRYGNYIVPMKKALQHMKFLTTPEGKKWIEECDEEQITWNQNWTEIHQKS